MPFNHKDKRLAQHWKTHNRRIHWPVACNAVHHLKHEYVTKADILNTCG